MNACARYARVNACETVATYVDTPASGNAVKSRQGLRRLLKDAAGRKFDLVIVEGIERLGRDISVTISIFDSLEKSGVEVHEAGPGRASIRSCVLGRLHGAAGRKATLEVLS